MFYQFEPIGDENVFEEFCKDILNSIYKTNSFQFYKTKGAKQDGIDIISWEFKIAVQVKKKKLARSDSSIERELIADLEESTSMAQNSPFNFKTFLFLTTTKKYSRVQDFTVQLSTQMNRDIIFWAWEDIERHVAQYPIIRSKYYPHLFVEAGFIPKYLTHIPDINNDEVVGREQEGKEVEDLLAKQQNVVLVNGIGGVGKSTLAKYYIKNNEHLYDHILWIDINNSVNPNGSEIATLQAFTNNLVLCSNLKCEFQNEIPIEERFFLLLNRLQNITGKNLMVIDNASHLIGRYRNNLPGRNWRILMTSREIIDGFRSYSLDVLGQKDAELLFYRHYHIEKDDRLKMILKYIGNHTLSIELVAKTASKRRLTILQLIEALENQGLNFHQTAKVSVGHAPGASITTFDYLLEIFSIAKLSDSEWVIMRYFSILPAVYIPYVHLKQLIRPSDDNVFFDTLSQLEAKGWIKLEGDGYQMHQVIQEVLRNKLSPNENNCLVLIQTLSDLLTVDFEESPLQVAPYLQYAESVVNYIDGDSELIGSLYQILAFREEDFFNLSKALNYLHKALEVFEKDMGRFSLNAAGCYNLLQSVYKTSGNIDKALEYQLKALNIEEKILDPLHPDLGTCYNNLGLIYQITGEWPKALDYHQRAVIIAESSLDTMHPHLAGAYNNLSLALYHLDYIKEALEYQEKSFSIRINTLPTNHPLVAEAYGNISVLYQAVGRKEKAKSHLLKSIQIRKDIYSDRHYSLGASYNNLAALYMDEKNFKQAKNIQALAISIEEETLGSHHYTIATTYSTMAVIELQLGDRNAARKNIERAIEIAKFNFVEGHESLDVYYHFLSMLNQQ